MTQQIDLANHNRPRILRLTDVRDMTGVSRSAIYDMMRSGEFPKSLALGARSVGWLESEIVAWIDDRAQARSGPGHAPRG